MTFNTIHPNFLMSLPLSVIFFVSLMHIYMMFVGKFRPPEAVWRGMGGAVYIFGCGVWAMAQVLDVDSAAIMLWGIAITKAPRAWRQLKEVRQCIRRRRPA